MAERFGLQDGKDSVPERKFIWLFGCGCLSMKQCHLFNPDDELHEQGQGAQRITC